MTVLPAGYAFLDEVWSDPYLNPQLKKEKKNKKAKQNVPIQVEDPICSLYEMGQNNRVDNDLLEFANSYYDKYDKSNYQNPQMLNREKPVYYTENEEQNEDTEEIQRIKEPQVNSSRIYYDSKENYRNMDNNDNSFDYMDLLLYIISGIILIFMMEQFVKLGMLLH